MPKKQPSGASGARECSNCGTEDSPLQACGRCGLTFYCSRPCQRQHWRNPSTGHRRFCVAREARRPQSHHGPPEPREAPEAAGPWAAAATAAAAGGGVGGGGRGRECAICLDDIASPGSSDREAACAGAGRATTPTPTCTLPCGHAFHVPCVAALRALGVAQACPLCRAPLPPGPQRPYEDACRGFLALSRRVAGRRAWTGAKKEEEEGAGTAGAAWAWEQLTASERRDMEQVLELWRSAANQGHAGALNNLGLMCEQGRVPRGGGSGGSGGPVLGHRGTTGAQAALGWYRAAAEAGEPGALFNAGCLLDAGGDGVPQDNAAAAAWYRAAAEAGHPQAMTNLGVLHARGHGVPQSSALAAKWYAAAARRGCAQAAANLDALCGRPGGGGGWRGGCGEAGQQPPIEAGADGGTQGAVSSFPNAAIGPAAAKEAARPPPPPPQARQARQQPRAADKPPRADVDPDLADLLLGWCP